MKHRLILFIVAGCLLAGCRPEQPNPEAGPMQPAETEDDLALDPDAFEQDERIVFFGDSITQAGVEEGGYVALIDSTLQHAYPDKNLQVIGAGISGNKVPDLLARVDRDVLAHQPTRVVVYIGINDVWHWFRIDPEGTEKDVFEEGLRTLVNQLQDNGAEVLVCTPSVIGENPAFDTPEDEMLDEYAEVSRAVATETGAGLCDLRAAFKDYLEANNPDSLAEGVLTSDTVHLNAAGNEFVARQLLQALANGS